MFIERIKSRYYLRNVQTMHKILGGFFLICLLMGGLGGMGIWTTSQMQAQIHVIVTTDVPTITSLSILHNALQSTERDYFQATLETDAQLAALEMDQVRLDVTTMQQAFDHYRQLAHNSSETADITTYVRIFALWFNSLQLLQSLASPNNLNAVQIINLVNDEWQPQSVALSQVLTHMTTMAQQRVDTLQQRSLAIYYQLLWFIGFGMTFAFLAAITLGWLIARHISQPLLQLVEVANRVASGNLAPINDLMGRFAGRDEVGQLLLAFNTMLIGLSHLIQRVRATSESIVGTSNMLGVRKDGIAAENSQQLTVQSNQLLQATVEINSVERLSTELAQAYQTIQQQAITDPLTGLPNHRAILERLDQEVERARRSGRSLAIVFFDGDRFKRVNDTFGHTVGDLVLQQLGQRTRSVMRTADVLGRYGGEEFVAILPELSLIQAEATAERMRAAVASSPLATDLIVEGINMTISIGLAVFPDDSSTAKELLVKADEAMYLAKKLGRNQVRTVSDVNRSSCEPQFALSPLANEREDIALGSMELLERTLHDERSGIIASLLAVIRLRDPHTGSNSAEVQRFSTAIAQILQLPASQVALIAAAAALHDIGKIGIPDAILSKSTQLTAREWDLMRQHPDMGAQILDSMLFLRSLIPAIRHHHEHWDGSGYPDGLKAEQIPLDARIIAIASAYQDMISDRPYRRPRSVAEATAELQRCAGTQFDPGIVASTVQLLEAMAEQEAA